MLNPDDLTKKTEDHKQSKSLITNVFSFRPTGYKPSDRSNPRKNCHVTGMRTALLFSFCLIFQCISFDRNGFINTPVCFCHFKACPVGPEPNLLEPDVADSHRVYLDHPILSCADVEAIKGCGLSWCKVSLVLSKLNLGLVKNDIT